MMKPMKILVAGQNHREFRFQVEHQGIIYFFNIQKPQTPPANVTTWLEIQLQDALKTATAQISYSAELKSMVGTTIANSAVK